MKTFSAAVLALGLLTVPTSVLAGVPFNSQTQAYLDTLPCRELAPNLAPRDASKVEQQLLSRRWWVGPGRAGDGVVEVRQGAGLLSDRCALDHQQWFVFRQGAYEGTLLPSPVPFEQAPRRARMEGDAIVLEWVDDKDRVTRQARYSRMDGRWQEVPAP